MPSDYKAITEYNEHQLGRDTASRKTQISMYSDSTHFVYEILQNADDYGATEVLFKLSNNELLIEHNGEPFIEENVKAITYFGKSTSRDDLVKTGRFGVGFKSVFAFAATPIIISGDEHFQIYGLYRVKEYPYPDGFPRCRTRIVIPFNHEVERPNYVEDWIQPEEALSKISTRLTTLNMNTLLFTRNIREIRWEIEGNSGHYLREDSIDNSVRYTTITDGEQLNKYLVFSRVPQWENQEYKAVDIAFVMDENDHIASAGDSLYVLFATKQETHLKFILNGPYRTNPARETISEDDPFNKHLMKETCELMKEVLPQLRERGLLTIQFLAVLPNENDKLPDFYRPIQKRLLESFRNENLTPMKGGTHAPAAGIYQGGRQLSALISDEDLATILGKNRSLPLWVANPPQRNQREDNFLSMLNISAWATENLVNELAAESETTMNWLAEKTDDWHQILYVLLDDFLSTVPSYQSWVASERKRKLSQLRIVRCSDGKHRVGSECYFPSDDVEKDERMPRIVKAIYSSGKNKVHWEKAQIFLKKIGVREVGEAEEIAAILKRRYSCDQKDSIRPDDDSSVRELKEKLRKTRSDLRFKRNFNSKEKDIERFIEFIQNDQGKAVLFSKYCIFHLENGKWRKPRDVYLDAPYLDTGLRVYYEAFGEGSGRKWALSPKYRESGVGPEWLAKFAEAVGVQTGLDVVETNCGGNPDREYLWGVPGRRRWDSSINRDYMFPKLEELLKTPDEKLSKLVWRTMGELPVWNLRATFQKNRSHGPHTSHSQLVHHLRNAAWVPQKEDELLSFVKPRDASIGRLPGGFPYETGQQWLDAIEFGKTERARKDLERRKQEQNTQNYQRRDTAAKELGFPSVEEAQEAKEMVEMKRKDPEGFNRWLVSNKAKAPFPTSPVTNPERRQERLEQQHANAPGKGYETRERSVRTTRGEIDPGTWLKNQYTNSADQMICQICKEELPFKKRDGNYYFEAVEALSEEYFTKEHEAQFLALCPLCAAMYKEFIKREETAVKNLHDALKNGLGLEIPLELGELQTSLRFVESHRQDIKTILHQ